MADGDVIGPIIGAGIGIMALGAMANIAKNTTDSLNNNPNPYCKKCNARHQPGKHIITRRQSTSGFSIDNSMNKMLGR